MYLTYGESAIFDCFISCWGDVADLQGIIVHFGTQVYQSENLLYAVDLLFKLVKVFRKRFPISAKPVWQLITKLGYNLPVPHLLDSIIKACNELGRKVEGSAKRASVVCVEKQVAKKKRLANKKK